MRFTGDEGELVVHDHAHRAAGPGSPKQRMIQPDEEKASGYSMKAARRLQAELAQREQDTFGHDHLAWLEPPKLVFAAGEDVPHTWKGWCAKTRTLGYAECLRMYSASVVQHWMFPPAVELLIIFNCLLMAVDPRLEDGTLATMDHTCTALFLLEILIKISAYTPGMYFEGALNWLDIL